jgi:hypothetical protein
MKPVSKTRALDRLSAIQADLRSKISNFESRAKSCIACETPGACCRDVHFVNVHISRLEAAAINNALGALPADMQRKVAGRVESVIENYGLTFDGDTYTQKFACPLFEKGLGCLVHRTAKPVPCIVHACYENEGDLPPDALQDAAELAIDSLNTRVYGRPQPLLPLPLAISRRDAA